MELNRKKIKYHLCTIKDINILIKYRIMFLNEFIGHMSRKKTELVHKELYQYFKKAIPKKEYVSFLAKYNDTIIGVGGMVVWKMPAKPLLENGLNGYILNMYTIPEARSQGICTAILNNLIKQGKKQGVQYFHLHASKKGINIYKKAGFNKPDWPELDLRIKK